ncbi:hypothetical protein AGMMS49975_30000 [Clostridia bacterium]|nr:hypothetical protein AGMMS49975_30000 [Clostridia bacterium]
MTEILLTTRTLPEPKETGIECPLLGMFADGGISVDKFLANKREEKKLEL